MPNSNKEELDIQESLQKRIQKADRVAKRKGSFNIETFAEGDEVWIQNPNSRKWDKKGTIQKVRKWNNRPLSYVVEGIEGGEYLRIGKYLCHVVPADFPDDV